MKTLKENLKFLLRERGWTVSHLARQTGIARSSLNEWLSGRQAVNLESLRKVAHTLNVPVHRLAYGEADPHEHSGREFMTVVTGSEVRVIVQVVNKQS